MRTRTVAVRLAGQWSAALVLIAAHAGAAVACSCLEPGPARIELQRADAIFVGEVHEIAPIAPHPDVLGYRVYFRVSAAWKGALAGGEIRVQTNENGGMCGYRFEKGERYLVYASLSRDRSELWTSICSRTRSVMDAKLDLDSLGAPVEPAEWRRPSSGELIVTVTETGSPAAPWPNVEVSVEGVMTKGKSDATGHVRFRALDPGRYVVRGAVEGHSMLGPDTVVVRAGERTWHRLRAPSSR